MLPMVWATSTRTSPAPTPETRRNRPRTIQPELAFYRKYTEGMLRRYATMSLEAGRVPSLLGREMFRGKVTNYQVNGFDDVVIFLHDLESCMRRLDADQQRLILRIGIQQFTLKEVAKMFRLPLSTVHRMYNETMDSFTGILLEVKLLQPFINYEKSCQEG